MATIPLRVVSGTEARVAPESRVLGGGVMPGPDVRIDGWLVQPSLNMLTREQMHVRLRPQLMDVLMCLASHPGVVFTPDELVDAVWGGRFIAASGISRCIAELRSALGDDARKPHLIETITKRGYRLIAPVQPALPRAVVPQAPVDAAQGAVSDSRKAPFDVAQGDAAAPAAAAEPESEFRHLWRRIERAAGLLAQRAPVRAFRS